MTACKQPLCAMTHLPCFATSPRGRTEVLVYGYCLSTAKASCGKEGGPGLPLGSSHAKVLVRVRTWAAVPVLGVLIPIY